jgi:single-stranded DNA-binding protein
MDVNLVVLCGRLAAPPKLHVTAGGFRYLEFWVALRHDGPRPTLEVVPVRWWGAAGKLAEYLAGDRVWVIGEVRRRLPTGEDDLHGEVEVVAERVSRRDPPTADDG